MMGQNALEPQVPLFEALTQGSVRAFNERAYSSIREMYHGGLHTAINCKTRYQRRSLAGILALYRPPLDSAFEP